MAQFRTDTNKLDGSNLITRFEVNMLSDRLTTSGTITDAFGRLRISNPLTLFDSSHRFADNGLWATSNTAGTTYAFVTNNSMVNLNVGTGINQEVIRETKKVFSYQPGKSMLILTTFIMERPKTGLRQRVGYFGAENGVYLENDGTTNYFVLRSYTSGFVTETRIAQSDWNVDKFDGTGLSSQGNTSSGHTAGLDVSKAQIIWFDIEWLGVGDVRCGFVVDGALKVAHIFHHDNIVSTGPYMTTASLPLRYEIKNTAATASSSTLHQICSSVMSEGGYELRGVQQAVQIPIGTPIALTTAGTFYPIVSIRLKTTRLDAIVILTALSILGATSGNYCWKVVAAGTTSGGTWTSAGADSSVEYNLTGTSTTGGRTLASGYLNATNQGSSTIDILKEALFKFQLERDGLTGTPYELSVIVAADSNNKSAYASMDWEEISR